MAGREKKRPNDMKEYERESFPLCGMMWDVSRSRFSPSAFVGLSRSDRLSAPGFERRCDGLPVTWSAGCV